MDKKKILIFLAFCFGISWLSAGIFYWCGGDYKSIWGFLLGSVYMFFPLISVLRAYVQAQPMVVAGMACHHTLDRPAVPAGFRPLPGHVDKR